MSVPEQFALLIQAAGTFLLFLLFLLLYRKIRQGAFLDWIASWGFLLVSLSLQLWRSRIELAPRVLELAIGIALVGHLGFLLRGARRFRDPKAGSSAAELLWLLPLAGLAWMSLEGGSLAGFPATALLRAAGYVATALIFAMSPGSPAGRILLSVSFLLWGVERAIVGLARWRFGGSDAVPTGVQYLGFAAMFLEMTIAVGIIILLFEATQARLAAEMEALQDSDRYLKEMGIRDPLTGLYNRNHFNDVIRRELASVKRYGLSLSVLLADVDRFKQINDVKGHAVGDDVLKFVAAYLTSCVRESDFVFRWGGDEFLVLLPRTDEAAATQKAEELARLLPNIPGTEGVHPALSVGWATHRVGAEFPATLGEADARMYEVKLRGKREREERDRDLGRLS